MIASSKQMDSAARAKASKSQKKRWREGRGPKFKGIRFLGCWQCVSATVCPFKSVCARYQSAAG